MVKTIIQFFQNLFKNPALQKFEQFCEQVFIGERPIILGALKDIATLAVSTAQTTGLSSDDKRKQAFAQIETYAKQKGIEAGKSMLNLALEMAVTALKVEIIK